jgi:plastocyanin
MRRLTYLAALALVATLTLAPSAGAQGQTKTVSIEDFFFSPATMSVAPGTTVTWVNNGQAPHTSTADDGTWDSGTLQPGENFSFTFDQAGTYTYHCNIHPNMTATITVGAGGGGGNATKMSGGGGGGGGGGKLGIPRSGGPAILLPGATLLLGLGVLTYAILRRR